MTLSASPMNARPSENEAVTAADGALGTDSSQIAVCSSATWDFFPATFTQDRPIVQKRLQEYFEKCFLSLLLFMSISSDVHAKSTTLQRQSQQMEK